MRANKIFNQFAGASVPWYLSGGIIASTNYTIYDPFAAVSQAVSYVNLANPGTRDANPVVAPTWSAGQGWDFNGTTQYLDTGIKANNTTTTIIMFEDSVSSDGYAFGVEQFSPTRRFAFRPSTSGTCRVEMGDTVNGSFDQNRAGGAIALSSAGFWQNGVKLSAVSGTWANGAITINIFIGTCNVAGSPTTFYSGRVLRFASYNFVLSDAQVQAVMNAMQSANLSALDPDYSSRIIALNPTAYWPCNNNTGANGWLKDQMGNRRFGYSTGYTGGWAGKYGNALKYVSGGGISCAAELSALIDPKKYSISSWIRATTQLADQKFIEAWTTLAGGGEYSAYEIRNGSGVPPSSFGAFFRENSVSQTMSNLGILTEDTWQHIVCYNDQVAGKAGMYVNGVLAEQSKTTPGLLLPSLLTYYPLIFAINGYMQHIAFWDHKLVQSEVNQICT